VVRPPRDESDVDFDTRWRPQRALPAPADTPPAPGSAPARKLEAFVRELAKRRNLTLVLLPRSDEQRRHFEELGLADVLIPEGPVDGVSLIAAADFVLGASGVMGREAVALGTPAYTLSRRSPAAVDAALLAGDRLKRAQKAADIALRKKDPRITAVERRDPQAFVDEVLGLARRRSGPARLGRLGR
jgi:hypothetical protein